MKKPVVIFMSALALLPTCLSTYAEEPTVVVGENPDAKSSDPVVKESRNELRVTAEAPIPAEVDNESQAKALSQEAALVRGQTALLKYIELKKTHSKKTLAEAEYPYIELQDKVHGYIKGAHVVRTEWLPTKICRVTLALDKKFLNEILSKN